MKPQLDMEQIGLDIRNNATDKALKLDTEYFQGLLKMYLNVI